MIPVDDLPYLLIGAVAAFVAVTGLVSAWRRSDALSWMLLGWLCGRNR